jgi:cupin superfamily acireductone dioxygenase involved in methionine salvage
MAYTILMLLTASTISNKVAEELQRHRKSFSRLASLQLMELETDEPEKILNGFEHVTGVLTDPETYRDFDVVIICIENDLLSSQEELVHAIFAGGARHVYCGSSKFSSLWKAFSDRIMLIRHFQVAL